MEPPRSGPPRRRAAPLTAVAGTPPRAAVVDAPALLRVAAAVGAAAVAVTSAGDGFVVAALLGLAAGPAAGLASALSIVATVARWGTADLAAVAGDQDVLGPAVAVGPAVAAASSALAALALVLLPATTGSARGTGSPGTRSGAPWLPVERLVTALACGGLAAALAAGPAVTSVVDGVIRVGAVVAGAGLALLAGTPVVQERVPRWLPLALGAAAVGCALA